nr:uncharacterized protein LOC111757869 [Cavia porcellus]
MCLRRLRPHRELGRTQPQKQSASLGDSGRPVAATASLKAKTLQINCIRPLHINPPTCTLELPPSDPKAVPVGQQEGKGEGDSAILEGFNRVGSRTPASETEVTTLCTAEAQRAQRMNGPECRPLLHSRGRQPVVPRAASLPLASQCVPVRPRPPSAPLPAPLRTSGPPVWSEIVFSVSSSCATAADRSILDITHLHADMNARTLSSPSGDVYHILSPERCESCLIGR